MERPRSASEIPASISSMFMIAVPAPASSPARARFLLLVTMTEGCESSRIYWIRAFGYDRVHRHVAFAGLQDAHQCDDRSRAMFKEQRNLLLPLAAERQDRACRRDWPRGSIRRTSTGSLCSRPPFAPGTCRLASRSAGRWTARSPSFQTGRRDSWGRPFAARREVAPSVEDSATASGRSRIPAPDGRVLMVSCRARTFARPRGGP